MAMQTGKVIEILQMMGITAGEGMGEEWGRRGGGGGVGKRRSGRRGGGVGEEGGYKEERTAQ